MGDRRLMAADWVLLSGTFVPCSGRSEANSIARVVTYAMGTDLCEPSSFATSETLERTLTNFVPASRGRGAIADDERPVAKSAVSWFAWIKV